MTLTDGPMWKCECGREYNASKLDKCPACGRTRNNAGTGSAPAPSASYTPTATPVRRGSEPASAVGPRTRELADKVDTLGGYLVFVAWVLGILSVVGGLGIWVAGSRGGGFITGAIVSVAGLVQAAFVGLIGRYAQMRAAQATGS